MMLVLHLASTLAVVVVTATTLAHALEMPGKLRLPRDTYLAVQRIYYPGFTVVGAAELPSVLALAGSALATSTDGPAANLRWAAATLAALAHAVYWLVVHPTNHQWLRDDDRVDAASSRFFAVQAAEGDWARHRRRWERGHLLRCLLMLPATALAMTALATG